MATGSGEERTRLPRGLDHTGTRRAPDLEDVRACKQDGNVANDRATSSCA
jgi:hypothetical protein